MPNRIIWDAAASSIGEALGTHINALANAAYSTVGAALDNTTNLVQYAWADVVLASATVGASAYIQVYMVQSLDGTTYEDAPSSTNPGTHMLVDTMNVTNSTAAHRVCSRMFRLPPAKFKFVLYNATGVALGATGNTVTIMTAADEAQ